MGNFCAVWQLGRGTGGPIGPQKHPRKQPLVKLKSVHPGLPGCRRHFGQYPFEISSPDNHIVSHRRRFLQGDSFTTRHIWVCGSRSLEKAPDTDIWKAVFDLITSVAQASQATRSTPPPPPRSSLIIPQTSHSRNTSSLANSSELPRDIDPFLRDELLGELHVNTPGLFAAYFDGIEGLSRAAQAVYQKCNTGIARSTMTRTAHKTRSTYKWSEILVPGKLKNDRKYDIPSGARLVLARYAREVLSAQDDRRFVLGFTLCGPILRVWEFGRCGGIASDGININKDGLRFISVMLGFLFMDRSQLGFDPTVVTVNGRRCIEIECGREKECLVIDEVILRAQCIAGRATTCWRAHRKADDLQMPLVIKDSWQYSERDEEGELLRQATECGVTNGARYDSHVTVQVDGKDDDIQAIRKGLSIPTMNNQSNSLQELPKRSASNRGRKDPGNSVIGQKRSFDCMDPVFPPPSKRTQSNSLTKVSAEGKPLNRVHRRVIVRDYGIPIFKSSSKVALLKGIELCIEGEQRDGYSGARGKTGTRAFMAIGVLYGENHSFMHDLESFFWVLFWICVHYEGPGRGSEVGDFEEWNYMSTERLAGSKKGVIDDEGDFLRIATDNFTPYYQPLVSWVNRLRRIVFPGGRRWKKPNPNLGLDMRRVIQETYSNHFGCVLWALHFRAALLNWDRVTQERQVTRACDLSASLNVVRSPH
ncbi:predicted protein [Histoplasma mississippiense (nom. inval.)]|uniref:predicted protein n=1 Tax=Ajellomyces capsulatus (strain NAm1 / WU24) TaxID=2059318 RepID=UPI000157D041|nr:predicted protein [Histoplasma mississippiense (nom. inval.)]EDN10828.1 predicted protein [Histoplasma mississippiense (nom. inval.)]